MLHKKIDIPTKLCHKTCFNFTIGILSLISNKNYKRNGSQFLLPLNART